MKTEEFNIGDSVWLAQCGQTDVQKECPVCFGKLKVRLELGNGDMVTLPCGYCSCGYSEPRGVVGEYERVDAVKPAIVTGKEVREFDGKREIRYTFSNGYCHDVENVCATKEEAEARCAVLIAEYDKDQKNRMEFLKDEAKKTFAWNAGYHMRGAARAKRDLEYHTAKAFHMKARAAEQKPKEATLA